MGGLTVSHFSLCLGEVDMYSQTVPSRELSCPDYGFLPHSVYGMNAD